MRDDKSGKFYFDKGEKILINDLHNRHRGKFDRLNPLSNSQIILVDLNRIGYVIKLEDQKYIKSGEVEYELTEDAVLNNQVEEGDKVFFGLYSQGEKLVANYVEPFFETIEDLESLK